jgi:hypothetical protein
MIVNDTIFSNNSLPMSNDMLQLWYAGAPDESGNKYSIVAGSNLLNR